MILTLCALCSVNALALSSSLQPEEIEEAYSLGHTSNHEELADFLAQYEHDFKYPPDNSIAFAQSVEFRTPYEQIVLRSLRTTAYSKFQARDDYEANPGLIVVRVVVALKNGYSGPEPSPDTFKVVVSQAEPIEPRKEASTVLCDPYTPFQNSTFGDCVAYSREIELQFDAGQFSPGKATVKIMLPHSESMETKYNLDKLK